MKQDSKSNSEVKRGIVLSSIAITAISLFSMFLGFLRNSVIASRFGTSILSDGYFMAAGIELTVFHPIIGSLTSIFVPQYAKARTKGKNESDFFFSKFLTLIIVIMSVLAGVAFIFSPAFVSLFAPGFDGEQRYATLVIFRTLLFLLPFSSINALFTAVLNVNKKYVSAQLRGMGSNIVVIILLLFFSKQLGLYVFVVVSVASTTIQFLFLLVAVRKIHKPRPSKKIDLSNLSREVQGFLPLTIGSVEAQILSLVDKSMASSLPAGSISAISYANTIISLVQNISYTPIQTVIYPEILERNAAKTSLKPLLLKGASMIILLMIPITAFVFLCSKEIISVLFRRGDFSEMSVTMTSGIVGIYMLGAVFNCLLNFHTNVFIAKQEYWVPTITGGIALIINVIGNILLIKRFGLLGLAIATAFAQTMNALIQIIWLNKRHGCIDGVRLLVLGSKVLLSTFIALLLGSAIKKLVMQYSSILILIMVGVPSLVAYMICLRLLKVEALSELIKVIFRREKRANEI